MGEALGVAWEGTALASPVLSLMHKVWSIEENRCLWQRLAVS